MGYGEAGGGGSVQWQFIYDDPADPNGNGTNPTGKKRRGEGTDKGTGTSPGDKMYVFCEDAKVVKVMGGQVIVEVTLQKKKGKQVVLVWGDDIEKMNELRDLRTSSAGATDSSTP